MIEGHRNRGALPPMCGELSRLDRDIAERLRRLPAKQLAWLATPPVEGRSQPELYRDACLLTAAGFEPADQYSVIAARFASYYRAIPDREIHNAIAAAGRGPRPNGATWPKPNEALVQKVTAHCGGALAWLREHSPVPDPSSLSVEEVLDLFFAPSDLVCVADSQRHATTDEREFLRGEEDSYEFVVPNPMTAKEGVTKRGVSGSPRCESNAAKFWSNVVVEFDSGSEDSQAARILYLVRFCALRMVVHSGGKSLHAWFDVRRMQPEDVRRFQRFAAALGADPKMFKTEQLARLPNAWRESKQQKQAVRYLNDYPASV